MVLKLYTGALVAGASGIVALVLAEKKIPFEYVLIDQTVGENKTPEFLALHPFGQMPDDDGFILYESRAIARYLAEKYADQGTPLLPLGIQERGLFEQAASIEISNFNPAVEKVFHEVFRKPYFGQSTDQAALAEGLSELSARLDVYEVILGKHKFLVGDEITLADLFHVGFACKLAGAGVDIMTCHGPNVARWWNAIISRPSWIRLQAMGIDGARAEA